MDYDKAQKAILNGIAEGMEKEADSIEKDEQKIRDAYQPEGRVLSEKEQERLSDVTASLRESVSHLRKTAAQLRICAMPDD